MTKFFARRPIVTLDDWRILLPEKHWRKGYSAYELAYSWLSADGFPPRVRNVLDTADRMELSGLEVIEAFPEHQVQLDTPVRPAQPDLLVLAKGHMGFVCIAVEGKVAEPFDKLVREWKTSPGNGKRNRLSFLCRLLGLSEEKTDDLRYQLLHRTASAVLEAKRYGAICAVMLVHSFSPEDASIADYSHFGSMLGIPPPDLTANRVGGPVTVHSVPLFLAWVRDVPC